MYKNCKYKSLKSSKLAKYLVQTHNSRVSPGALLGWRAARLYMPPYKANVHLRGADVAHEACAKCSTCDH